MKIALFTETYTPYINGGVVHVRLLKKGLEALGHEVLVVTASSKVSTHTLRDGVLYCPAVEMKKIYGYGLASPVSRSRLKLIADFNPDIIHIHNEFG
ncbi:MAG: glycosyltransferase, partial [Clostridia bacterium]|nr:glycosyltransferase [Clostridia bacterium]